MAEQTLTSVVDSANFRQILSHFPSGVVVVTAMVEGRPVGMTISAFCSLSLDPPRVLFCPAKASATWQQMTGVEYVCVNILGVEQEELCQRFATRNAERFADVTWHLGAAGSPRLEDAMAWIECRVGAVLEGGDHQIVVGDVVDLRRSDAKTPLVYFRGQFLGIQHAATGATT